eukprot:scaffold179_cov368-Prasinococcus_capsulatus_cf.AAC.33
MHRGKQARRHGTRLCPCSAELSIVNCGRQEYLEFELDHHHYVVISMRDYREYNDQILGQHGLPSDRSNVTSVEPHARTSARHCGAGLHAPAG